MSAVISGHAVRASAKVANVTIIVFAIVALAGLYLFMRDQNKIGTITFIAKEGGPSVTIRVADSDDIGLLIAKGLENEQSADYLSNTLVSIMQKQTGKTKFGLALLDMVQMRRGPFVTDSVHVNLFHDEHLQLGEAAVCEHSVFLGRSIVVYVVDAAGQDKGRMMFNAPEFARPDLTFPCADKAETIHINNPEIKQLTGGQTLAKLNF